MLYFCRMKRAIVMVLWRRIALTALAVIVPLLSAHGVEADSLEAVLTAQNTEHLEMAVNDSLVEQLIDETQKLRNRINELEFQNIKMQGVLEHDSLRIAERKARIDSLRSHNPGTPLVVEGDTLLVLYARKGGMLAQTRVENAHSVIVSQGKRLTLFVDSIYVYESEFSSDVMAGEHVILSLIDDDGLWQNTTRQKLAGEYCEIIKKKIEELHEEYGLKQKLIGLFEVVLILLAQWLFYKFTRWLYHRYRFRLLRRVLRMPMSS